MARAMAGTVPLWYRRRYNLPPNHPLYLSLSTHDMLVEYWAHHYDNLFHEGKLESEAETEDWDKEIAEFLSVPNDSDEWETVIDE